MRWLFIRALDRLGGSTSRTRRPGKPGRRERTRRELAAYVAEGSIPAEKAERLLLAMAERPDDSEWKKEIASLLGWGSIEPDAAERLLRAGQHASTEGVPAGAKLST